MINTNLIIFKKKIITKTILREMQNDQKYKPRILIIGAGPSGLSLLRAFQVQKHNIDNFPDLVCCQKQADWGGQWNYIAKAKYDQHGRQIPQTNEYLWTNAPKQCFQYPDYSFDEHFGRPIPSYMPRMGLKSYFTKRFQKHDIKKYIRFETIATDIHFNQETKKFSSILKDLKNQKEELQLFDYVVIATGHFANPFIPQFEGMKTFKGNLIHSTNVKDYQDFINQRVLVVGSGLSAEDSVLQCYRNNVKKIMLSYRTKPSMKKWPEEVQFFPLISKIQEKTVYFQNGQSRQVDTIIMCTGYTHNFSFLQESLRLKTRSRIWPLGLYMGIAFEQNPQLFYIGMQYQYFSFMKFDVQCHMVRDIILKRIKLPSYQEMKKDSQKRREEEEKIKTSVEGVKFIGNYVKDMIQMCNYPNYKIDQVINLYLLLDKHKEENILTFRQNIYQSTVSGTWSILKQVTWLSAGPAFQQGNLEEGLKGKIKIPIEKNQMLKQSKQINSFENQHQSKQ